MNVESDKKLPLMLKLEKLIKIKFFYKVLKGKSVFITWISWPIMGCRVCEVGGLLQILLKISSSVDTVDTLVPFSSFIPLLGNIIPENIGRPGKLSCDFSSLRTFIQNPLFIYLSYIIFRGWQVFLKLLLFIILSICLWSKVGYL